MKHHHQLIFVLLFSFSFPSFIHAQDHEYDLNWNFENDKVKYTIRFDRVNRQSFPVNLKDKIRALSISDDQKLIPKSPSGELRNQQLDFSSNYNLELAKSNQKEIVMEFKKVLENENNQGNSKRFDVSATLDRSGKIKSFWVPPNKKFYIELFGKIPERPIEEGEIWYPDIVSFTLRDKFNVKDELNEQKVFLKKVKRNKDGELVAWMKYNILQAAVAKSKWKNNNSTSILLFTGFSGSAKFNIAKGRWSSMEGFLRLIYNSRQLSIDKCAKVLLK